MLIRVLNKRTPDEIIEAKMDFQGNRNDNSSGANQVERFTEHGKTNETLRTGLQNEGSSSFKKLGNGRFKRKSNRKITNDI